MSDYSGMPPRSGPTSSPTGGTAAGRGISGARSSSTRGASWMRRLWWHTLRLEMTGMQFNQLTSQFSFYRVLQNLLGGQFTTALSYLYDSCLSQRKSVLQPNLSYKQPTLNMVYKKHLKIPSSPVSKFLLKSIQFCCLFVA